LLLLLLGQLELLLLLQFPLLLTKRCNDWPAGNSKLFSSTYVAERSLNPAAACDADASRVPQATNGALMQLRPAGNDCMLPQLLLALCGCQDQQGPAVARLKGHAMSFSRTDQPGANCSSNRSDPGHLGS
jgi:hypothetical protein